MPCSSHSPVRRCRATRRNHHACQLSLQKLRSARCSRTAPGSPRPWIRTFNKRRESRNHVTWRMQLTKSPLNRAPRPRPRVNNEQRQKTKPHNAVPESAWPAVPGWAPSHRHHPWKRSKSKWFCARQRLAGKRRLREVDRVELTKRVSLGSPAAQPSCPRHNHTSVKRALY